MQLERTRAFDNALAYDEENRAVIKSTCKQCGESKLVSIRDRSLTTWEAQHVCPGVPKIPPRFSS
jgi:hypothetical protein